MKVNKALCLEESLCLRAVLLLQSKNLLIWQDRQKNDKMTKTLKIFSSVTVDGRKYSKSFCSYTVGQALRFFKYNNNLCET